VQACCRVNLICHFIPYLLSFSLFNNVIFRIFLVLVAFIGNKFNQAKNHEKEQKGTKKEEQSITTGLGRWHDRCWTTAEAAGQVCKPLVVRVFLAPILFPIYASFWGTS